jgi:hypothetical protein
MRKEKTNHFESECSIECTDNGKTVTATVDRFKEKESLVVLLEGKVRVNLRYTKHGEYVGSMSGLEFVTQGPKFLGSSYR